MIQSFDALYYHRQGCPPSRNLREIWNTILYVTRSGCSWRMLAGRLSKLEDGR